MPEDLANDQPEKSQKRQLRKLVPAGLGKDADEIYHADQEAEDYDALSTEDDS